MEWIKDVIEFFKSHQVEAVVAFIALSIEYWLGKTDMVKPGSMLEVVLMSIKKAIDFIRGKKA